MKTVKKGCDQKALADKALKSPSRVSAAKFSVLTSRTQKKVQSMRKQTLKRDGSTGSRKLRFAYLLPAVAQV